MPRAVSRAVNNFGYTALRLLLCAMIGYVVLTVFQISLSDPLVYILALLVALIISWVFIAVIFGAHDRAKAVQREAK